MASVTTAIKKTWYAGGWRHGIGPTLSARTAFPPRATPRAWALSAQFCAKVTELQRILDQLRAEGMNSTEADLILNGPELLTSMLLDDIQERRYAAWHDNRGQLAQDLEHWRLLADPPPAEAERLAA